MTHDTRLINVSTLRIGIIHVLTIVHMLYLSSKPLFVHIHGGQDRMYSGGRTRRIVTWVIAD